MGGEPFMNPEVARFYNNIVNTSSNEPYEDAIRFLEFVRNSESENCILNMRQDASTLVSADVTQQIIERHMKFLLLVQFEYTRSLPSHDPDSIDSNLSEWAAQILERLSVCSLTQSNWKDFIKKDLVDRFASSHGKTLAQIYMNIGLEPPSCLPHLDEPDDDSGNDNDRVIDNPSSFSLVDLEDPSISVQGPKTPLREMLSPRTAKISARNSLPRALFTDSFVLTQNEGLSWFSASQISPESSIASTSYSQPSSQVGRKYATRSKLGASAPHLVLMPASKLTTSKGKRKGKTPVKRGLGQLSQSPTVRMDSRSRRRIPSGSHSGSNRRKSLHRSVAETPNWKMSQPRWERARMAAAEKTRGRLVVVAETPIKPSEPGSVMTSPLRRLRRASSLLNFRRGYSSSGGAVSSTSTSRLSIKAEQWQRRLMEEEASLSQFSGGESSLSLSTSSSQFQRRSSNLMANFLSLPSPHSSAKDEPKPPLTSAASSPPVLNLSMLKSGLPRRQPPPVSFEGLFHDLDAPCSTTTSTQPMLVKTPLKSKPTTSATPKRRKAGPRGQVAATEVPISSHVFDEAAMFPGEGEFFQRPVTDLDSSMLHGKIQSLGCGESHITPRKCAPSPSSTSDADEDNFKPNLPKGVGITILGLRDPLTPIGKTRSVLRCETSAEQPVMCGGGPFMTPRKQTLCLHSSGCGSNEESRSGAKKEGGYGASLGLQEPLSPTSQTSGPFQSGPFEWSPSNPSASATKEEGILSFHQVTTRRITPRKGLFRPTSSSSQELSPGAPSTSAAKRGGSLPLRQTATKRTTPRKGLFRSTPSPLRALSSGIPSTSAAKRRGSLPFHQTAAKRTTPCKGPLRPTITTPPPPSQVQANVEKQKEERAHSPRRRLRTRRSLFR